MAASPALISSSLAAKEIERSGHKNQCFQSATSVKENMALNLFEALCGCEDYEG